MASRNVLEELLRGSPRVRGVQGEGRNMPADPRGYSGGIPALENPRADADVLGNVVKVAGSMETPGTVVGVQRNVPSDDKIRQAYEDTENFRPGGPRPYVPAGGEVAGGRGGGYERPEFEDPMEQWYSDMSEYNATYEVGSRPELEAQLAAGLGWSPDSGEGMYEFLDRFAAQASRGGGFTPGERIPGVSVQSLLGKAGIRADFGNTEYQNRYEEAMGR